MKKPLGNLLCVANFPANTGFAWKFIEDLYASLADRLSTEGILTWVAYPLLREYPRSLRGSSAEPLELPVSFGRAGRMMRLLETVRSLDIRTMYLSDRPVWHPGYAALRTAGLKTLVVHDHTSGERDRPGPVKGWLKRARYRMESCRADRVIAVSDFVLDRKLNVDLFPAERVTRIWNSVVIPRDLPSKSEKETTWAEMGLDPLRPVIGCASRASKEKGIAHLLRAFEIAWNCTSGRERPQLIYFGDGPFFSEIQEIRSSLDSEEDIHLFGYVEDADSLLGCVTMAVVPSIWHEAFGLAALEPMAMGVPVVATGVGGIPEVVRDGKEGYLVTPGSEGALAEAIMAILSDPAGASRMGARGRLRAEKVFNRESQVNQLEVLFLNEMRGGGSNG